MVQKPPTKHMGLHSETNQDLLTQKLEAIGDAVMRKATAGEISRLQRQATELGATDDQIDIVFSDSLYQSQHGITPRHANRL